MSNFTRLESARQSDEDLARTKNHMSMLRKETGTRFGTLPFQGQVLFRLLLIMSSVFLSRQMRQSITTRIVMIILVSIFIIWESWIIMRSCKLRLVLSELGVPLKKKTSTFLSVGSVFLLVFYSIILSWNIWNVDFLHSFQLRNTLKSISFKSYRMGEVGFPQTAYINSGGFTVLNWSNSSNVGIVSVITSTKLQNITLNWETMEFKHITDQYTLDNELLKEQPILDCQFFTDPLSWAAFGGSFLKVTTQMNGWLVWFSVCYCLISSFRKLKIDLGSLIFVSSAAIFPQMSSQILIAQYLAVLELFGVSNALALLSNQLNWFRQQFEAYKAGNCLFDTLNSVGCNGYEITQNNSHVKPGPEHLSTLVNSLNSISLDSRPQSLPILKYYFGHRLLRGVDYERVFKRQGYVKTLEDFNKVVRFMEDSNRRKNPNFSKPENKLLKFLRYNFRADISPEVLRIRPLLLNLNLDCTKVVREYHSFESLVENGQTAVLTETKVIRKERHHYEKESSEIFLVHSEYTKPRVTASKVMSTPVIKNAVAHHTLRVCKKLNYINKKMEVVTNKAKLSKLEAEERNLRTHLENFISYHEVTMKTNKKAWKIYKSWCQKKIMKFKPHNFCTQAKSIEIKPKTEEVVKNEEISHVTKMYKVPYMPAEFAKRKRRFLYVDITEEEYKEFTAPKPQPRKLTKSEKKALKNKKLEEDKQRMKEERKRIRSGYKEVERRLEASYSSDF